MILELFQRHDGGPEFPAVRNPSKCLPLSHCCTSKPIPLPAAITPAKPALRKAKTHQRMVPIEQERLDPENGILLAAHIDALFDRGLITFLDDGAMLISKRVSDHDPKL